VHHKAQLPLGLSLLLCGSLVSCSSPKPPGAPEAHLRPASTAVPQLRVVQAGCDGPLCEDFTVEALGVGFQIDFGTGTVDGEGDAPVTGFGDVTLDFDVPAGFQFSAGQYFSVLAFSKDDPGTRMVFSRRYQFEGASDLRTFTTEIDDSRLTETRDVPEGLWSPSCGEDSRSVRLQVHLSATVEKMDSFQIRAFHSIFSPREGVQWRHCGDTDPTPPPASGEGEDCGGGSRLECAPPLGCEFSENDDVGTCVDPAEVREPQELDHQCGGLRAIPCQDGLVCHYREAGSREQKKIGFCKRDVGGQDETCGGVPDLPCVEGLTCLQRGALRTCVRATGDVNSHCGPGLPACKEGLECGDDDICLAPAAGEGEPCGGPLEIRCKHQRGKPPLECAEGVCRPVSPPDGGA
jgi:hypothetical protein